MENVGNGGAVLNRTLAGYRSVFGVADWPYGAAALLGLAALVDVIARPVERGESSPFVLIMALAVTMPVALVRVQPVAAAALVVTSVLVTLLAQGPPPVAGLVALAVVLHRVGRYRSPRTGALLMVPFLAGAIAPIGMNTVGRQYAVFLLALALGAYGVGAVARTRADAVRRDESVRAMADTLLDHAARGERARIARVLHDVVAHHISMIAVQAEAARLTTPGMPPEGARRLVAIGDTARTALTEMRRLLGVLREDAGPDATRRPQPGLQQLNDLLDGARGLAGASTRLIVYGRITPLDPGLELAAYRIVQEALTNARRHAPGAAVDVELNYQADALHLRVRDNGPGPPAPADASAADRHGLTGMRERAATVGGRLTTGAAATGGFLVEAVLPTEAAPVAAAEVER
jgi:signal transduction histidine kinase